MTYIKSDAAPRMSPQFSHQHKILLRLAGPLGNEVMSMLEYLSTEVKDAIIEHCLAKNHPAGSTEQVEADCSRQAGLASYSTMLPCNAMQCNAARRTLASMLQHILLINHHSS